MPQPRESAAHRSSGTGVKFATSSSRNAHVVGSIPPASAAARCASAKTASTRAVNSGATRLSFAPPTRYSVPCSARNSPRSRVSPSVAVHAAAIVGDCMNASAACTLVITVAAVFGF
ncbi:hypothetical protein Ae706Ps2_6481c [Pseudonocardia sp. Ae706_Ps2]|nr:hypothetical protein Ae706Ps2_6481c [Pseudonocardia sp. Ae706_Ps2]